MPTKLDKMSFAHLKQSDHNLLEHMLRSEQHRHDVLTALIAYLSMWHPERWIDVEKLHLLGRDIDLVCPPDFRSVIANAVLTQVHDRVAKIFMDGFNARARDWHKIQRPPAVSQLEKVAARLERGPDIKAGADIEAIIGRYLAFTEGGGDPGPLIVALSRIGDILVKVRGPMRPWAANLARRLVQEGLRWAPDSDRLWGLWGRSLATMGAFEASETVYWDALRRFPWNAYLRSHLIQVVKRQKNKRDEALRLATESFRMFPSNGAIVVQLAALLAQSKRAADVAKAIDILLERIRTADRLVYEISALASILADAAGSNILTDHQLRSVVQRLRKRPQMLGGISYYLLAHHKAFALAQELSRRRVEDVQDDVLAWSQWAKAFAETGNKTDVNRAMRVLRDALAKFPEHPSIRNHLAKLLVSTGAPEDRKEALDLLRETMKIVPDDIYAPIQLAEAEALSGDPAERQEAIRLLERVMSMRPGNEYAKELLELILATPEGTPITVELKEEIAIESNEDHELAEIGEVQIDPAELVPADVVKLATVRRLRFQIKNGLESDKAAALQEVRALLQDTPFAYAKLLAIRQGIWSETDQAAPIFAFAFERALRDRDEQSLENLSERFPRLAALTIVAKAVLGDPVSAAKIANVLSADEETLHPAVRALRRRMKPHLTVVSAKALLTESKDEILEALYDANEAALHEPALAA
jgi:tetratricopeptide (TPR) repeat protein